MASTRNWAGVPAAIFSDHMVLQREAKVPIWGVAKADDTVTIIFNGQTRSAVTGTDGVDGAA